MITSNLYEEETALLNGCIQGVEASWQEFRRRYDALIRFVCRRTQYRWNASDSEVEDMVAVVYTKLWENRCGRLVRWRRESKFETYLTHVVKNLCIDCLRALPPKPADPVVFESLAVEVSSDLADADEHAARLKVVQGALGQLPSRERLIIEFRLEGLSLRQIAKLLNVPVGTVSADNSHAMEKLRCVVKPACGCEMPEPSTEDAR